MEFDETPPSMVEDESIQHRVRLLSALSRESVLPESSSETAEKRKGTFWVWLQKCFFSVRDRLWR